MEKLSEKEKYELVKKYVPKPLVYLGNQIEKLRKSGVSPIWWNGFQCAMESEMKCQVMSAHIDSEMAYIVADYFGVKGPHWENIEPLHMKIAREKNGSIIDRLLKNKGSKK